jgi:hypothetical protein
MVDLSSEYRDAILRARALRILDIDWDREPLPQNLLRS